MRTFVAINPSQETILCLEQVLAELLELQICGLRCVRPNSAHLTLKFLGNINPGRTTIISEALYRATKTIGPIKLHLTGLGVFPDLNAPKVIWIGIDGSTDMLGELRANVEDAMADLGFPKDQRWFKPHLTLARVRRKLDPSQMVRLMGALNTISPTYPTNWQVNSISLTHSKLTPDRPIYHNLITVPLGRN